MAKTRKATRSRTSARDYCAIARRYADDVLSGAIPACKWVKLACQRQLDDLKRTDFPYHFDESKAKAICRFIELLPHVKGRWKTATIVLEPWQIFILTTVFGWVADGTRRFRTVYIEVPRKNAKSTISSGVALYLLAADGETGAEVYSLATTRDQARIVFDDARAMAKATPQLCEALGVDVLAHAVTVLGRNSTFRALSADANTLDGLNIHGALVDEFHAHKTRAVWDVINTATGARRQALKWIITTAGFNRSGVCYEQRGFVAKLLERLVEDDSYFGSIWTIDDDDDWTVEPSWRKANPNYGVSVLPGDIATLARQAVLSSQSQNNFLTKRLNVWVNADSAWMNMAAWDACADPDLRPEDFEGQPCYLGVDLASKIDVAAKIKLFPPNGDRDYWVVFGNYYLPEAAVEQGVNTNAAHYAGWAREGIMTLTPGEITDIDGTVKDGIIDDMRRYDWREMAYDPFQAITLINGMERDGVEMSKLVEYGATVKNFSEPMKQLEALVLSGKLKHNGDPCLAWMMSNVVAHTDAKDNIFPRKERPENKIDGPVAMIMALGRALAQQQGQPSIYDDPATCVI